MILPLSVEPWAAPAVALKAFGNARGSDFVQGSRATFFQLLFFSFPRTQSWFASPQMTTSQNAKNSGEKLARDNKQRKQSKNWRTKTAIIHRAGIGQSFKFGLKLLAQPGMN